MSDTYNANRTATQNNSSLIDSGQVEGTAVYDPSGKHIEKVSGRVVYAVASFGGFLGLGGKDYTIPWNMLRYDPNLGGYRTSITEEQLKGSPDVRWDDRTSFGDRHSEQELYDYYESSYYW
jgi:hypothetical protein